jgi:chorismate synthase
MASNSFGTLFKITTWGESHGSEIGVVIDGCPAGLAISEEEINQALKKRAPGQTRHTSSRLEQDGAKIISGVFEGVTTGAPIAIAIANGDADSSKYEAIKDLLRPGHANFTYLEKYGHFDHRGGGRASARETAARVAAGFVAKKFLKGYGIETFAYLLQLGEIRAFPDYSREEFYAAAQCSPIYTPDRAAEAAMIAHLDEVKSLGDSLGGVVEFYCKGLPAGLGDPVYEKLEAKLAFAMMSIPASKGFEIGEGFMSGSSRGSMHNDLFSNSEGKVTTKTNHAGGILGGISTGMPMIGRVAFKPTSSINRPQETLSIEGEKATFTLPAGSRHDPCVAIRAVPVVEAMASLVLADALLLNRGARL